VSQDNAGREFLSRVLALLERQHGIGARGGRVPAWVEARLDQALGGLLEECAGSTAAAERVLEQEPLRLAALADTLRVGQTSFFREPKQWQALRERVLPARRKPTLRGLSAGCSTGEEAWTLAMVLQEAARSVEARSQVVGIDRHQGALDVAAAGRYPKELMLGLPPELLAEYVEPSGDEALIREPLKTTVSFVRKDLARDPLPGSFDVVICKNVLIYFGEEAGRVLSERLFRALSDGGVLLVARSEVSRLSRLGYPSTELAEGVVAFSSQR
jgi:chemotaxis protein methyltransferase CheR